MIVRLMGNHVPMFICDEDVSAIQDGNLHLEDNEEPVSLIYLRSGVAMYAKGTTEEVAKAFGWDTTGQEEETDGSEENGTTEDESLQMADAATAGEDTDE